MLFFFFWLFFINYSSAFQPSELPPYCTEDMSTRDIPALSDAEADLVESLIQVQIVIRHGSRTPASKYKCWQGYNISWINCSVTTLMLPDDSYTDPIKPAEWLFRLLYDGSPNDLGGNCKTGQMIGRGYEQESQLGDILEAAYTGISSSTRLKLYDSNLWSNVNVNRFYYRVDDETRTLQSGQIVLQNMFNATGVTSIIDIHTGDRDLDQIDPNTYACPRLNELSDTAYASSEWIKLNTSRKMVQLNSDLDSIFGEGYWNWNQVLDCTMTTVCTYKDIPSASPDGTVQMTDSMFNDMIEHAEERWAYRATYDESEWAQTGIGGIIYDIRAKLSDAINADKSGSEDSYQFVLFSAHDTTIMPILASLYPDWDRKWSGYASLLSLELYRGKTAGDYYFRMIYNGKPMVLPTCNNAALCNADAFLDATEFAQPVMDCAYSPTNDNSSNKKYELTVGAWVGICIGCTIFGAVVSAMAVVYMVKVKDMLKIKRKSVDVDKHESSVRLMQDNEYSSKI